MRVIVTSRQIGYTPGLGEDFAHYNIADFDDESITQFVRKWLALVISDPKKADIEARLLLATISTDPEVRTLAQNPLMLTMVVTLLEYKSGFPSNRIDLYEEGLDLLLQKWDAVKGIQSTRFDPAYIKDLLAELAFSAIERSISHTIDSTFVLSVFSNELLKRGVTHAETLQQSASLLSIFKERSGLIIESGAGIYSFVHRTFQEFLAAIALTKRDNFIEFAIQRHRDVSWEEVILFSIARINRASLKTSEDALCAIMDLQNPESILFAGRCMLELGRISSELRNRVTKALKELVGDSTVVEDVRMRAEKVLEKLDRAQVNG